MTLYQYYLKPCPLSLLHSVIMNFVFLAKSKSVPTNLHLPLLLLHGTLLPLIFLFLAQLKCHVLRKTFSDCLQESASPRHTQLHYPTLLSHSNSLQFKLSGLFLFNVFLHLLACQIFILFITVSQSQLSARHIVGPVSCVERMYAFNIHFFHVSLLRLTLLFCLFNGELTLLK